MRPEAKQPKTAAGLALIFLSVITVMMTYEYNLTRTAYYIAAALYVVGMVLILIPGRKHENERKDTKNE